MPHLEKQPRKNGYVIKINEYGIGASHQTGLFNDRQADYVLSDIKGRVRQVKNGERPEFADLTREGKKNFLIYGNPSGAGVVGNELKLSDAVEQYLDRDIAPTTIKTYRSELYAAVAFFGGATSVDDITKRQIQDWITGKGKHSLANAVTHRAGLPLDQASIRKRVGRLKQLFIWLNGRDELKTDALTLFNGLEFKRNSDNKYKRDLGKWESPAERVARLEHLVSTTKYWHEADIEDDRSWKNVFLTPTDTADLIEFLSFMEYEKVVAASDLSADEILSYDQKVKDGGWLRGGPDDNQQYFKISWNSVRLYGATIFAAYTGCRRSEILRFTRSDVDFENKTVVIRRMKGRGTDQQYNPHIMPLVPKLEEFLKSFMDLYPDNECVFSDNDGHFQNGEFIESRVADKANRLGTLLRRALQDYKYPALSGWHMYRHGLVSQLHSDGHNLDQIAAVIGHQTQEVTKIYAHVTMLEKTRLAAKMMNPISFEGTASDS